MAEGAMYYLGPGLEAARRRQEEQRKRRGGLTELLARGVMAPGNVLQGQLSELPEALGAEKTPEILEALKGLDTLISGYEETTPQTPLPGEEGFMGPVQPKAPSFNIPPGDFVGPQQPEPQLSGLLAGLPETPPGGAPRFPTTDRFDRIATAAKEKEDSDKRQMLLALTEGLIRGGRTASNVRGLSDILAGQAKRPADQSTADQLAKVRELMGEKSEKALAAAKNPIVDMYNKQHGTNFETPEQVREATALRGTEAKIGATEEGIKASEAKRSALESSQEMSMNQMQKYADGQIEAAPDEIKKMILDRRKEWRGEALTGDMRSALDAARKIDSLLDAENSTASRTAVVHMVKVAGDTGRLSDQDIARFQRRMGMEGVKDWLHQIVYSDLTEDQKDEFREIAEEVRGRAIDGIRESARDYVSGISDIYPELKEDQLMTIFLGKEFGKGQQKQKKFWATVVKPIGDYAVGEPIEVTEEEFQQNAEYLER